MDTPSPTYPADCHLSIIVEKREGIEQTLHEVLKPFKIVSPLTPGTQTPSGHYNAWRVTVEVGSTEELHAVDKAIRAVPGVRMIL